LVAQQGPSHPPGLNHILVFLSHSPISIVEPATIPSAKHQLEATLVDIPQT
jgi:hypothetical protein